MLSPCFIGGAKVQPAKIRQHNSWHNYSLPDNKFRNRDTITCRLIPQQPNGVTLGYWFSGLAVA